MKGRRICLHRSLFSGIVILMIGLLLAASIPASAAKSELLTKEQALEQIKGFAFYPAEAVVNSAVRNEIFGVPQWEFVLNGKGVSVSLGIQADDGKLLYMSVNAEPPRSDDVNAEKDPALNRQLAEQIAADFIRGLQWGIAADWRLDPYPEIISPMDSLNEDKSKQKVRFVRYVNGIRYDASTFTVFVDPNQQVAGYYASWQDAEFEDPTGVLSQSEAERIYGNSGSPTLYYLQGTDGKPKLVYNLWQLTMDPKKGTFPKERNFNPHPGSGKLEPVSAKPLAALVTNAKLTDKEMLGKAKALLGVTGEYILHRPAHGQYYFQIPTGVKNRNFGKSISFDLNTGQVDLVWTNDSTPSGPLDKPKISETQARKNAETFVKKALPAYADKLAEYGVKLALSSPNPGYWFRYNRVAGGIAVDSESLMIEVSAVDGKIRTVQSYLTPLQYPAKAVLKLTAEQVKKKLLSLYDVELRYEWKEGRRVGLLYELVLKPEVPRFYLGSAPVLDASTGKWLNIAGEPISVPFK